MASGRSVHELTVIAHLIGGKFDMSSSMSVKPLRLRDEEGLVTRFLFLRPGC